MRRAGIQSQQLPAGAHIDQRGVYHLVEERVPRSGCRLQSQDRWHPQRTAHSLMSSYYVATAQV